MFNERDVWSGLQGLKLFYISLNTTRVNAIKVAWVPRINGRRDR